MRNIKLLFFLVTAFLALNACQTVTTKIDKSTEQEKKELSQWLNKSETNRIIINNKTDIKNSFTLSNDKLFSKIKINLKKNSLKIFCNKINSNIYK